MNYNPENWRGEFAHIKEGSVYVNHAAISPFPKRTVEQVNKSLNMRRTGKIESFESDELVMEKTRYLAAKLIGAASEDQIAFISNTTHGLNIIANGFPFRAKDEILLHPQEFPTNVYPWLNQIGRNVGIRFLPDLDGRLPAEVVEQHITDKTRLISLSAVQFISGYKADLKTITELCHKKGIYVIVDGIQAAGVVPIDVQDSGIDAFCTGGHKWLMSPQGTGFMYIRDELKNMLRQTELGWLSVEEPWDFFNWKQALKTSAQRFECGMPNTPGLYGMCASLDLLLKANPALIYEHVVKLGNRLADKLTEAGFELYTDLAGEHRSGITTFHLPEGSTETSILEAFAKEKVYVSVRNKLLRFSPHFYSSDYDIAKAAETAVMVAPAHV